MERYDKKPETPSQSLIGNVILIIQLNYVYIVLMSQSLIGNVIHDMIYNSIMNAVENVSIPHR